MSQKPSRPGTQDTTHSSRRPAEGAVPIKHGRAHSESAVAEHIQTASEVPEGALRIVIDRSAMGTSKAADKLARPTLEIPIPHYRLGTPCFSTQGTPMIRNSEYTSTSGAASESARISAILRAERPSQTATSSSTKGILRQAVPTTIPQKRITFAEDGSEKVQDAETPEQKRRSVRPIEPAVFDDMAKKHNDPTVVRYSIRTGDIVAATPARIIAQISSENFMDYDLVSDFFLTFRPYLSTRDVLGLLLARLRWAITRMEEDGRIIRIRTFAALRHWILNYFLDDFVVNRKLRVEFCKQINDMYKQIRLRNNGGTSDLKILQDLKRCWNGRCSLYWDSDEFVIDNQQEAEIVPGGVLGSRDSTLTRLELYEDQAASFEESSPQDWPQPSQSWFDAPPARAHAHRQQPAASPREAPHSISSQRSLQAHSCSIPTRGLRRSPQSGESTTEPHPVPLPDQQVQSALSASAIEYRNQSLDRARERNGTPSDAASEGHSQTGRLTPILYASPHATSVIRGNVFPPGSPYIEILITTTAVNTESAIDLTRQNTYSPSHARSHTQQGGRAPTRSLMGSIKRAFSQRHTANAFTPSTDLRTRSRIAERGKTAGLPLNIARSNDGLRTKATAGAGRNHLRIDLLCAAVAHSFQEAQAERGNPNYVKASNDRDPDSTYLDPASLGAHDQQQSRHRMASQVTAQSGSIVIVDDTGLDIPLILGALPVPVDEHNETYLTGDLNSTKNAITSVSQYPYDPPPIPRTREQSSGVFALRRSRSLETTLPGYNSRRSRGAQHGSRHHAQHSLGKGSDFENPEPLSATTTSTTMRRHASYDSSMMRHDPNASLATATSVSDQLHSDEDADQHPAHALRRRPGGNLRKIQNVHDLETGFHRHSTHSAFTETDSAGGSLVIMSNQRTAERCAVPGPPEPRAVSLIHTHSSQHLRPSFEAAVSGFSAIPDDADGGLEATLLKLEGRYQPSPQMESTQSGSHTRRDALDQAEAARPLPSKTEHRQHEAQDGADQIHDVPRNRILEDESASRRSSIYGLPTASGSDTSERSIPLLEQSQVPRTAPGKIPRPLLVLGQTERADMSQPSFEMVEETASMKQIPRKATMPIDQRSPTANSFLLDADENLSDLSSELSVDVIEHAEAVPRGTSPLVAAPGTAMSGLEGPSHPLAHASMPSSSANRLNTPTTAMNPTMFQNMPLTPDPSPTQVQQQFHKHAAPVQPSKTTAGPAQSAAHVSSSSSHVPFILAYGSELLAEQLTLVEKAALSEVDWSDLVDMKWDSNSTTLLNWVDFLCAGDHKGVDLVITRFNIMVKWVISEVVLTQNIHERVQAIQKFIHIAAHARRLHNYATMLQITIALTSTDSTRLKKTWALVSGPEKSLLKNMEALIQPLRNFHDLRKEMETSDLTEGCVPFMGLYIHDLTYNAQKPAEIASSRDSEPLINFERYRTAATIVKGLLRLIEASSRYNFPPVESVIGRCLWVAALSDDRVVALSKGLET